MTGTTNLPATQHSSAVPDLIRPVASPDVLLKMHDDVAALIQNALREGVDYGVIPGTKENTLLKPGAEKLCIAFGAHPVFECVESEVEHEREIRWIKKRWLNRHKGDRDFVYDEGVSLGIYRYRYRCRIVRADGRELGQGEGVCSSLETKYVDRPRDCENTVAKMAQKRAHIAATLSAFGLSNRFSPDAIADDESAEVRPGARGGKAEAAARAVKETAAKKEQAQAAQGYQGTPEQMLDLADAVRAWHPEVTEDQLQQIHERMIGKQRIQLEPIANAVVKG